MHCVDHDNQAASPLCNMLNLRVTTAYLLLGNGRGGQPTKHQILLSVIRRAFLPFIHYEVKKVTTQLSKTIDRSLRCLIRSTVAGHNLLHLGDARKSTPTKGFRRLLAVVPTHSSALTAKTVLVEAKLLADKTAARSRLGQHFPDQHGRPRVSKVVADQKVSLGLVDIISVICPAITNAGALSLAVWPDVVKLQETMHL